MNMYIYYKYIHYKYKYIHITLYIYSKFKTWNAPLYSRYFLQSFLSGVSKPYPPPLFTSFPVTLTSTVQPASNKNW